MNTSIKKKVSYFIFFGIAALLLFFAFRGVDYNSMVNGFRKANYSWVALSLVAGFFSYVVRSLRWRLLIEPLGFYPSLTNTMGALFFGYVTNLAFPRLGEITRCASLRKTDKIPFESLVGTVIIERAFDVLMILLLVISVFFIRIDFFGGFIWDQIAVPLWSKMISLFKISPIIVVALVAFLVLLFFLLRKNFLGAKFKRRIISLFWGVIDGLKSVYTMKRRKEFFLYTILLWFLYWLMTWLLVFATEPTSQLGLVDGFFLLVIGSLGMAAPVQGGFGAFHIITAMGLGIYGISWEDGLIWATISHEAQTILMLAVSVVFMIIFFLKNRKTSPV
ncbi:MAG TPA: lysylphosphatidylglycerol synthase transmembrane domain-containing protein [Tenuifilaceae bacterium]|nr:lysylphosphatidylglycerol synthase transmembrane domain-containing protein [Tenuifilaceae bacterium]HPE17423.1 lysylphosphatidylglycerol synthase transmembrane domain-containing protein [Tenuifilaceae bacterium]HPJ45628.1 lysylphosphatidylglycerol synthase transmembrane domain-containing protein [Tenuifilaceae bacterium]HPQ33498.1 lysylphosphatidylglycerol synthase transmembrane domain-containing protein [Tenuifilaceae bacterium]HRX66969.1 lysylphosphatidylglycerol synthase transmembrane dom